jgi:hypothetical protein
MSSADPREFTMNACSVRKRCIATACGVLAAVLISSLAYAADSAAIVEITPEAVLLKQGALRLPVSLRSPNFTIDGAELGGTTPIAVPAGKMESGKALELPFAPIVLDDSSRLEVRLFVEWSAGESVLRKWAAYRLDNAKSPKLVSRIVLENFDIKAAGLRLLPEQPIDTDGVQSRPVFMEGFFAGIEYPVARCRADGQRLVLSHLPGLKIQPGTWYQTRKAVYGVPLLGEEKRAFKRYIDAHRPTPNASHHFIYNPYWTTPTLPSQKHVNDVMKSLDDNLYKPYGVAFDSCGLTVFTTDPKSIWKVDEKRFPRGLADLQRLCSTIGSHLDIFLSPSSRYAPALDPLWAKEQGYETFDRGGVRTLCLAGKRYQSETKKAIVDMVSRYNANHVFLDGYLFDCPASDHGHEPGILSAEPVCDGLLDILAALRKAAPDVWLAATCFTWNASPWWCFHVNSVIGCYGDDAPFGRVPSPVYRESYTSARDFFNLQGAHWLSMPIAAQESFGIIQQSEDPLLNDAVTDILRGNMEQHCAINPACMSAARWRQFASLVKWARQNAEILQTTEPLLPRSWQDGKCPRLTDDARMPREPYGYAHWRGERGIVMLRNPWIEPQTYSVRLAADPRVGSPAAGLSAVSLYPAARVYGTDLKPGDTLNVPLAPYETVVLSIDATRPPPNVPSASMAIRRCIDIAIAKSETSLERFSGSANALGADSTCITGNASSSIRVKLEATVTCDAPADLLILVEDKDPPVDPMCRLLVNGKEAVVSSGGSETGWAASGLSKPERWLFLTTPLSQGNNRVSLDLLTRGGAPVVSAWVWAKRAGSEEKTPVPNSLPQLEVVSLDGVALLKPVDESVAARTTKNAARPVDSIDGVFLDAMDPSPVRQTLGSCRKNLSIVKTPMVIAGRRYWRGLGVDCPSRIAVSLDGKYRRFHAFAGLDSATMNNYMDRSAVVFEVWVDGQKRWDSGPVRNADPAEAAKPVDLDVAGAKVLELRVVAQDVNGHLAQNFADWAMARLLRH